jgi:hypothetical protein
MSTVSEGTLSQGEITLLRHYRGIMVNFLKEKKSIYPQTSTYQPLVTTDHMLYKSPQ